MAASSGGEREVKIVTVDALDLTYAPHPWKFAMERRAQIDAHFADLQRAKPALWNGRVLLMHRHGIAGGVFRGAYLETDYASFRAWHDWGCPEAGVTDSFGAGAIRAADGAFLLAAMGAHTANAGRVYFPCGTPDPEDVIDGRVDFEHSVRREIREETGLDYDAFEVEPGWTVVADGPLFAVIKLLHAAESASALRARVLDHLAKEQQPELAGIRIVRGPADLDPMMPRFVTAFLGECWR